MKQSSETQEVSKEDVSPKLESEEPRKESPAGPDQSETASQTQLHEGKMVFFSCSARLVMFWIILCGQDFEVSPKCEIKTTLKKRNEVALRRSFVFTVRIEMVVSFVKSYAV